MSFFVTVTFIVAIGIFGELPTTSARFRILGGSDTTIEEYPHQVAIENEGENLLCGGSIVSSKIIVTAAHPFMQDVGPLDSYMARIGSTYREGLGQIYPIEQLRIHPKFQDEHRFDYDVAIIVVKEEINFSLQVEPIPIVNMDQDIPDGTTLILTGYGLSSLNGQRPNKLQVAQMVKRNLQECNSLGNDRFKLTDRMLCVGKGIPTPYRGDSGGPLINKERQLVGIVSWGKNTPEEADPAIFTKVAHPSIHNFIMQFITKSEADWPAGQSTKRPQDNNEFLYPGGIFGAS